MARDIQLVVEDELSEAVLRKLTEQLGNELSVYNVYLSGGFGKIESNIQRFKNASNVMPHIILTDLDKCECVPSLMKSWTVGELPGNLLFRVAVRAVEAWLLADRDGIARFLSLPVSKIPLRPELEDDPKRVFISLVRKCKKRRLVEELAPATGSGASIGPLYNIRMRSFVRNGWNIQRAITNSDSLSRAVQRISTF